MVNALKNKRFRFGLPIKNKIVLFHESHENILKNLILPKFKILTYKTSPETFYISPHLLCNYIKQLFHYKWKSFFNKKITLRKFLAELINNYRLVTIKHINPKIIVTFIDDSGIYHWLQKNCKNIEFFAIQNGNRSNSQLKKSNYINHQHYFCFGDYEKNHFTKFNVKVKNYYSIGSIFADYYNQNNPKKEVKSKYDICIVSMWPTHNKEQFDSIKLMDSYINRFIKDNKLKAIISLRTNSQLKKLSYHYNPQGFDEKNYFESIYSKEIIFNKRDEESIYDIMLNSELIIGFLTTTIREAFGWGKKAIYCDFTGTKDYLTFNEDLLLTDPNYNTFSKNLYNLLNEPNEQYKHRTRTYANYVMNFDLDVPANKIIREKLNQYL